MKPDGMTWHEYLRGYGRLRWRSPGDEQRFHETFGLLQPLYALRGGKLLDSCGQKFVFALPTPPPVVRQGHARWTFFAQCLTTGRVSTAIPYERLLEFGVMTADLHTGGSFPRGRQAVEDRIAPEIARLQAELNELHPRWDDPSTIPWPERYGEYLQSEDWLALRQQVLRRDNHRCVHTGKAKRPDDPLQVHHKTYERVGREDLGDLETVCLSWHRRHHGRHF
jgi:hypothetical protein